MKTASRRHAWVLAAVLLCSAGLAQAGTKEDIAADMRAQRWTQAEQKLDGVLRKHPENALAHFWLAEVKFEQGQIDAAKAELQKARELDPSESFASRKTMLQRIDQAQAGAIRVEPPARQQALPQPAPVQAQPAAEAPRQERRESSSGGISWFWLLVLGGVGFVLWRKLRRSAAGNTPADIDRWRGALMEAHKDLGDAVAAADANPAFSPEQKLATYDRVRKAQADISAHIGTLATRRDFAETESLILRSRDIAAEIRGEEKPSDKALRLQEARLQAEAQARAQGPGYGGMQPGYGGGGGNALGTVAAVGLGAVLGSMMSGSAEASDRHRRHSDDGSGGGGYIPFDNGPSNDLDLGGSDGGASWDSGGDIDVGGGGGGDFD
ncbi:tetratricopeptide repeat protein [Mitsuaria sp. WAJ17]|uniref:tetratricopeptide repeat protein n=1 Tax=Mitsuaria sp. WAJ17 TaxID=2761452 RepID=UPI0015FFF77A|nr:tetratricopeptide repeat protein [Mitsuaria sp. WAJ17]MBB2484987.1 tetratricopeptide repeat protein [Mitsuaria sp. WAJ17]